MYTVLEVCEKNLPSKFINARQDLTRFKSSLSYAAPETLPSLRIKFWETWMIPNVVSFNDAWTEPIKLAWNSELERVQKL